MAALHLIHSFRKQQDYISSHSAPSYILLSLGGGTKLLYIEAEKRTDLTTDKVSDLPGGLIYLYQNAAQEKGNNTRIIA